MSWRLGVLLLLAATGCGGRWLALSDPTRIQPSALGPRRDYRVVLRNDSTVVLFDAVVRNDSIVEVSENGAVPEHPGPLRAVALADAVCVELWQPAGERIAGGVGLIIVAGLLALFWAIGRALGGSGG